MNWVWIGRLREPSPQTRLGPHSLDNVLFRTRRIEHGRDAIRRSPTPIKRQTDKMPFGDFTSFCQTAPLPLCAAVGPITSIHSGVGIETNCYARNIELANTIIFQMATSAIHIVALAMTVIMILHVRGKFTAVGTCSLRPKWSIPRLVAARLTALGLQAEKRSSTASTYTCY